MNYALYTLLFSAFTLNGGNGCSSSNSVKKIRPIREVVQGLPLERILMLHLRSRTADFSAYSMKKKDQDAFRKAVAARYEDNKEQIDAMAEESDNRYRQAVHVPVVRQRRKERRQPQRVKFPDSVVLQMKRN